MVTFLITSVLFVALFAIAIYFWQKPRSTDEHLPLPPETPPRALFSQIEAVAEISSAEQNGHRELLDRATSGDLHAIVEARDTNVYSEVLSATVSQANSEAKLLKLASHVSQNNLPVNRPLAEAMIAAWQQSPNRHTTAKAIHLAALADDADLYKKAVELALRLFREGKLSDISAMELQALLNGEYWLLSSGERNSGTGFVLKRTLSSARRELEGVPPTIE
jgi:hypothetical protein